MTADAEPITTAASATTTSVAVRWYVLLLMCLVYTLSIADRFVTSTVLEPIRLELQLSDSGVAFLTGAALAWFYVILGFPLSWLIDRSNRRNIIAISVIAWSAMTTLTGMARTQWQFLLARIGVGIGEAGGTPGANSLLCDYFPTLRRPMALTIFSLGCPLGAYVAASIAGMIADQYGWRQVFYVLGVPGVITGILVFLTIREPRRGRLDHKDEGISPPFLTTMRFLWRQRSAVHLILGQGLSTLWGWGLMFWTPTFLNRTQGLTPGQAGELLGPMHLVGGVGATLFTSWLVARPSMADPRRIARLMAVWTAVATAVSIVIYWTHSLALAKVLFWLFVPSLYFFIGPCLGIVSNLSQPRMRAMFCAVILFAANFCNLVVAPQLVGFLSDWFAPSTGPDANSLRLAMLCLTPTGFWAVAHYYWSERSLLADQERATGIRI
jgi:MFS family permease